MARFFRMPNGILKKSDGGDAIPTILGRRAGMPVHQLFITASKIAIS
jgi:hypothetical protein